MKSAAAWVMSPVLGDQPMSEPVGPQDLRSGPLARQSLGVIRGDIAHRPANEMNSARALIREAAAR